MKNSLMAIQTTIFFLLFTYTAIRGWTSKGKSKLSFIGISIGSLLIILANILSYSRVFPAIILFSLYHGGIAIIGSFSLTITVRLVLMERGIDRLSKTTTVIKK